MQKAVGKTSVERYRQRMRRAGYRLVQLWVPDTRARGFVAECKRQSRAATKNRRLEGDIERFIESSSDTEGWTG